jgi:serine protease Do
MKKKIFVSAIALIGLTAQSFAQENEDAPKAKKEEKVIIKKTGKGKKAEKTTVIVDDDKITVNGEPVEQSSDDKRATKQKRITVMVDGDNITINGKPVDKMTDEDIRVLKGSADHLGLVAPYMKKLRRFNAPTPPTPPNAPDFLEDFEGTIEGNFDLGDMPMNKALLGVVTAKDEKGAKISTVSKESAAEKAGLQKDDIITKINDYKIETSDDLVQAIGKHNPEDKVTVTYLRDGKTKTATATLGKNEMQKERVFKFDNMENMPMEMFPFGQGESNGDFKMLLRTNKPKMGIKIQDVEEGSGVKILEVDENTPASKAGLQKDDVISEINGEPIKTVDDLKEKTKNLKEGETYKVKFTRNGVAQTADIKFPKKLKTADL